MNGRRDVSAISTYSQSMRSPFWGQGDIPELVAAGRMIGCHIKVMVHHLVTDGFLSTIKHATLITRGEQTLSCS
jgi:hypothetical protein